MAGPEFFQTQMGHIFYEATMPRLVEHAARLATTVEALRGAIAVLANVVESHGHRVELALQAHAEAIKENTAMMESLAVEVDRLKK